MEAVRHVHRAPHSTVFIQQALEAWPLEDLDQAWSWAVEQEALSASSVSTIRLGMLIKRAVKDDPVSLVGRVDALENPALRARATFDVASSWPHDRLKEGEVWAASLPSDTLRDRAYRGLLNRFYDLAASGEDAWDVDRAERLVKGMTAREQSERIQTLSRALSERAPLEALDWLSRFREELGSLDYANRVDGIMDSVVSDRGRLPSAADFQNYGEDLRVSVLDRLANQSRPLEESLRWVDEVVTSDLQPHAARRLAEHLGNVEDGPMLEEWAQQQESPAVRAAVQEGLFWNTLHLRHAERALERAASLRDVEVRNHGVRMGVRLWRHQINGISDAAARQAALRTVGERLDQLDLPADLVREVREQSLQAP